MPQCEHTLVVLWATDRHCTCDSHMAPTTWLNDLLWTAFVELLILLERFKYVSKCCDIACTASVFSVTGMSRKARLWAPYLCPEAALQMLETC